MIINESKIFETKSINLGDGKSAYSYNGKYYIKSGDTKKEISADQYDKLRSKDQSTDSKNTSDDYYSSISTEDKKDRLLDLNDQIPFDHIENLVAKYEPDAEALTLISDDTTEKVYKELRDKYLDDIEKYGDDAEVPYEAYDLLDLNKES